MDDGYGGMVYVPNPDYKEQQKLGKRSIFILIRLLQLKIVSIELLGTHMVNNQSTPDHWPSFCWGYLTDRQMVDAKLQRLLDLSQLVHKVISLLLTCCRV